MSFLLFLILVTYIRLECLYAVGSNCIDNVYMRIPYTQRLITSYIQYSSVNSAKHCLELCKDHPTCKSVGIQTNFLMCYLYDGRVYAGLPDLDEPGMIYYWLLEDKCPIHLGYIEDSVSKICHKYYSTQASWEEAQTLCESDGGHLFMMETNAKKSIIINYYPENHIILHGTFFGGTDLYSEDNWNWLNGISINRSLFAPFEPNNILGKEHCLFMAITLTTSHVMINTILFVKFPLGKPTQHN